MAKKKSSQASLYREHLLKVLSYLVRSKPVGTYARPLLKSCSIAEKQLAAASQEDWSVVMDPWTLDLKGPFRRGQQDCIHVVMGAIVKAANGLVVYQSIPVNIIGKPRCFAHGPPWCSKPDDGSTATATRRLHFDFDAAISGWPKEHLQVGGNPQELKQAGDYYYAVAEDPSEPRVPTPSLDFVLVLDLILREFDTSLVLPGEEAWRKLVIRSETLCLGPYFARAHAHLQTAKRDMPLIEHLSQ